ELRGKYRGIHEAVDESQRFAETLSAEIALLRRRLQQVHGVIEQAASAAYASDEKAPCFPPADPGTGDDTPASSLEGLLGYYDEAFVRKAYLSLLRRPPDPTGLRDYLQALRAGQNRLSLLAEIQNSEEGRRVKAWLPGLNEALSKQKREGTLAV